MTAHGKGENATNGATELSTIIYIADQDQTRKFRKECASIDDLEIGSYKGLGTNDKYFSALGHILSKSKDKVDLCVFDEPTIADLVGAKTLMSALVHYINVGITDDVRLVVIDPKHAINNKGRSLLNKHDVRVVANIGELGPKFRSVQDFRNASEAANGITYDDNYTRYIDGVADNPDDDYPYESSPDSTGEMRERVESTSQSIVDGVMSGMSAYDDDDTGDIFGDLMSGGDEDDDDDAPVTHEMTYSGTYSDDDPAGMRIAKSTTNPFDDDDDGDGGASSIDDIFGDLLEGNTSDDDADDGLEDFKLLSESGSGGYDDLGNGGKLEARPNGSYMDDADVMRDMPGQGGSYFADDDDSVGGIFDDLMSGNVDDDDDASSALREYDDERDPYKRYGGQLTKDETRRLISFAEPSWDYDVINEALRKRNGIFRSKKPPMGTVSPSMLANSRYIADKQINEGAYAAPDETKLIVTMSPSGGVGKALPNDFAIPCYDGDRVTMATVGDISVGDSVVGSDGKPTMVLGVYPQGELETYEMAFEDGTTVPCSSNHIWTVIGDDGTIRDMTTGDMLEAGVTDADGNAIWRIPVASPIDGIAVDDGDARRCVDDVKVGRSIRLDVISCSQRQRKAVLDAVEEAYGVERDGLDVTVGVPSDMIDAVRTLACSLGMRCFVGDGAEDGVTLAYLRHVDSLAITGIRDLERKSEMTCLYVEADDHLFCVGDDFTLTHNTTVATMIGIQLNYYFNYEVLTGQTTSLTSRVLVLSLNEFDDIATKGIGYNDPLGNDDDGRNVAELKKRIEECHGNPEWDDISQCFVASPENFVFYLPSMTVAEKIRDDIQLTAEDYKTIINVCARFFGFIVLDMPDVLYDQRNGLVEFGLNNADVVCFVIEADTKNTVLLYRFIEGIREPGSHIDWDREKSILVVNKYATPDNPYLGYVNDPEHYGQIRYEQLTKAAAKNFCYAQAIPLTEYRVTGNILLGTDPQVKKAARDLADKILDIIDTNDAESKKFTPRGGVF